MNITTRLMRQLAKRRGKQLELYKTQPDLIQNQQLREITRSLGATQYGELHGISDRTGRATYARKVPIVMYEDIADQIERMLAGERHVLTPDRTSWFAKSSGTTNAKSKYIPVNRTHLNRCHYKGGLDSVFAYLNNHPESDFFGHKGFVLAGTYDKNEQHITTGDLSAVLLLNMPAIGRMARVPQIDIALHGDWEEKLQMITDDIAHRDIGNISGVPSWMLIILKELLRKSGAGTIKELWPNLEVFFHGGIAFDPYREEYAKVLGDGVFYQETYNASEGFFGVQTDPEDKALLLMLDYGVYYEFIPMSHFDESDLASNEAIPLYQVETDVNYALVISTLGGLYRYVIGDTIKFTSTHPYKFIITGRTKSFINAFGEELMVTNADEAFARLGKELDCRIRDYTAGPVFLTDEGKGLHHWVLEWEKAPSDQDLFNHRFDQILQEINSDYEAKRFKNFSLQPPKIDVVPGGTFYHWLKSKGKLGGQNKVIRLYKDDSIVREVLDVVGKI